MSSTRWRRPSSNSARPGAPLSGDDRDRTSQTANHDGPRGVSASLRGNRPRTLSTAGLSSSHNLPSRSYIHHASAIAEPAQYSSPGVREQTEELSSSFLSDSDIARRPSSDPSDSVPRTHAPIEERSEPVSPDGQPPSPSPVPTSTLSDMLKQQSALSSEAVASPLSTPGSHARQRPVPEVVVVDDDDAEPTEHSSLLPRARLSSYRKPKHDAARDVERGPHSDPPESSLGKIWAEAARHVGPSPKSWDSRRLLNNLILQPASMLPAVFLGLLLNLLDALSYGIILFPLGEDIFSDMGADGVSMFYVSCIVSQLVYSTGSIFRGGVGSEMIEVVPFFHKMTYTIMNQMGSENPAAVRATVITSYAMSSILTGVVFFVLGSARLGTLVNFFPHSILTGCIGGVGIFLFITGIEVSARIDGNLTLSLDTLRSLFAADTVALWIPPLVLAILLLTIKHFHDRPWLVPAYYVGITALFYIITTAVPSIKMDGLRSAGWVFEAPAAGVPFYNFYKHYNFQLVDWQAIWLTIPSQFALSFFGLLHVPINLPNLAIVVQEDDVSINRELILHGISNTLSGCVGSIQNYLVFVNSVLFMNTGGDSRLAGYLLAAATFGLWVAGPVVIGYVPVMVVGTLIYMLGIDLTMEAVVQTYGRLGRLEYASIVIIALVMGLYDFVVGICVGIGLACLVYVVQTSRKTVIRAEFSGAVAESTVRRHPRQRHYLHRVGPQLRVVKLGGYLFFGSIVTVEKKVRELVDAEAFAASPTRYLVLDFSHVTGIDFSAAEAFGRMNRILHRRQVRLVLSGITLESEVGMGLQMVGLFVGNQDHDDDHDHDHDHDHDDDESTPPPRVFENLNGALESCENELLIILNEKQRCNSQVNKDSPPIPIPSPPGANLSVSPLGEMTGSPRRALLHEAASTTITETARPEQSRWRGLKQPLPLILQVFQDLTERNEDFWFRAVPFFTRREFTRGQVLYSRGDRPDGFYLVQTGILRAEYLLEQGTYYESIVAGTTLGELPFFSDTERTGTVVAERDSVAWLLTPDKWEELQDRDGAVARELLKVGLKLSAERMNAITSHVLIMAS